MNTTFKTIKVSAFITLLTLGVTPLFGQNYSKAEWRRVKMDSAYDYAQGKATKVIENHDVSSAYLQEPAGKCYKKLEFRKLSDLVTDAMLAYGTQRIARTTKNPQAKADLSIVNFKNTKVSLPAGDVSPLDVIALFPMDNRLTILELKGKYIREIIENFAKRRGSTAIGGADFKTDNNILKECSIGGEPIRDEHIYTVVTIDFLLSKGDYVHALNHAENLKDCGMFLSNILIQNIKNLTRKGEMIVNNL